MSLILCLIIYVLAPAKKKTENGGKAMKRQLKKKVVSSDSDSEEVMFSNKQAPVSNNAIDNNKIKTIDKNL